MVDQLPRMLADRYEIGRLIGRGGMAQVHIAYDTRLSRTVAIKVLRSDMASDQIFLARFRREAQSAAALNHPAIVAVYDTGDEQIETDQGPVILPYIVMEYVKGRTVRDLLSSGDPIPIDEAAQIAAGVLSALEYSHREGIIHRDIKPGNIMLTEEGSVKVMDFGIARAIADANSQMTQTNTVVGTAQYLSPEQARGEIVDARSDLYSTGCLLYEMLTGTPPFTGDSPVAVAYQHVSEAPKLASDRASDIPESMDRVVMKSLAKKREDRYQDAASFRSDLLAAVRGQGVSAPATATYTVPAMPPAAVPEPPQWTYAGQNPPTGGYPVYQTGQMEPVKQKSNSGLWMIIALLVTIAALAIAWIWWDSRPSPEPTPTETTVTAVEVPDMTGMTREEATAALAEVDLVPNIGTPEESDVVESGLFLSSTPAAGTSVEPGSSVTLIFSAGVGETRVPNVSTMTVEDARAAIEEAGLEWGQQNYVDNNAEFDRDRVIKTDPEANTMVERGTTINVEVSSGRIEVPNLIGSSEADAVAALDALRVNSRVEQVETSEVEPGLVANQNYPGGSIINSGTTVIIYIAVAPTPTEEPTTEDPTEEPTTDQPTTDPAPTEPTDGPTDQP